MKAVTIPYVIALILGVIVVGIIGYWFVSQGGKAIRSGSQAECDTMRFNYCKGFVKTWDPRCGTAPVLPGCSICGNGIIEGDEYCEPPGKIVECDIGQSVCSNQCEWDTINCKGRIHDEE